MPHGVAYTHTHTHTLIHQHTHHFSHTYTYVYVNSFRQKLRMAPAQHREQEGETGTLGKKTVSKINTIRLPYFVLTIKLFLKQTTRTTTSRAMGQNT